MRWLAPSTWLALLGTATLSANCAIVERTAVCGPSQGAAELLTDLSCNLCASEACCAEASACGADPTCLEVAGCIQSCSASGGDPTCVASCKARPDLDPDLIGDLVDCVGRSGCGENCQPPELVDVPECAEAGVIPDALGPSCAACIRRLACAPAIACAGDETCAKRLACMAEDCQGPAVNPITGLTPGCFDNCRGLEPSVDVPEAMALPAPERADIAFFSEVARACRNECRMGRELSCVDAHDWPRAGGDTIRLQRIIQNRVSGTGVAGLDVSACFPGPGNCGATETATTDDMGLIELSLTTTISEFNPRAGFQGYLQLFNGSSTPADTDWRDTILIHTRPEWRNRIPDEIDPYAGEGLLLPILESIARNAEVALDFENNGVLVGGMVDCRGRTEFFVPNATLVIDTDSPDLVIRYVNESQLGVEREATATTSSGQFIAVNVPPGERAVRMVDALSGRTLATEPEVRIRPGKLTVIQFYPQPR